jgi:hypothetical protein
MFICNWAETKKFAKKRFETMNVQIRQIKHSEAKAKGMGPAV